ncbi:alkaline phosphatase family protein [Aromatoleum buckelii]|uniref:Phosphodiesterase n=1 Tax=Aromatoleum buckelii TaxID=200254 RepID=A0ABX1N3Z2_9RHOO|nr:alkaline phosphatase family protein [Aromatoleum buckelii]MCK0511515.1 alkaline phosphatase family protein [Aromatoleum buckelii]
MPTCRNIPFSLPRAAVVPDYGANGLYGLVGAIRAYLDGQRWTVPGEERADSAQDEPAPVLVFLLIDGLGDAFLQRFGAGSALLANRRRRLTSVFPSTTASAVTTTLTGLAPARHGLTGWFIHDRRFGGVVAPLPMRKRSGGLIRRPMAPERLFPYPSLFQNRRRKSIYVNPRSIAYSPYSARHGRGADSVAYRGLQGMVAAIATAARALKSAAGGYIHAYYPVFDALSHAHGCESDEAVAQFRHIDAAFAALLDKLAGAGVEVVASADHGFIDSPAQRVIRFERFADAAAMLAGPLFGERRAALCELRRGAEDDFRSFVEAELAGKAVLVRSPELLRSGFFGPGPRHRQLRERIGSHALLMEAGWTITDSMPGEHAHRMIGVHGGLSPQEMWVPLIHARC